MRPFEAAPEITAPTTDVSLCVPFGAVTAATPPPAAPGLRAGSSSSGRRAPFSSRRSASCVPPALPPSARPRFALASRACETRPQRFVSSIRVCADPVPRPVSGLASVHFFSSSSWVTFPCLLAPLVTFVGRQT